jgi:hypothetical protein
MKRHRLFLATLLTLLITFCTLTRAGWLTARHEHSRLPPTRNAPSSHNVHDPLASPSALRWRQGQPNHWRAFLLQR